VLQNGVSKNFRTKSTTKYTLTTINTRWEATQRVMAAKLTRLTHKIAIQLHLVTENSIICSSRSRRPVRKLLDTLSYVISHLLHFITLITLHVDYNYETSVYCSISKYPQEITILQTEFVGKVKLKVSLCLTKHQAMKTYWGSGGIAACIHDLGTRWRWVVSFTLWPLYSQRKSPWCPLDRGWVGPMAVRMRCLLSV
jgi:hypothetical protein